VSPSRGGAALRKQWPVVFALCPVLLQVAGEGKTVLLLEASLLVRGSPKHAAGGGRQEQAQQDLESVTLFLPI
jgi:hypothetical protein